MENNCSTICVENGVVIGTYSGIWVLRNPDSFYIPMNYHPTLKIPFDIVSSKRDVSPYIEKPSQLYYLMNIGLSPQSEVIPADSWFDEMEYEWRFSPEETITTWNIKSEVSGHLCLVDRNFSSEELIIDSRLHLIDSGELEVTWPSIERFHILYLVYSKNGPVKVVGNKITI